MKKKENAECDTFFMLLIVKCSKRIHRIGPYKSVNQFILRQNQTQ